MKEYFKELKEIFKETYNYIKENIYMIPIILISAFPLYVLIFAFTTI